MYRGLNHATKFVLPAGKGSSQVKCIKSYHFIETVMKQRLERLHTTHPMIDIELTIQCNNTKTSFTEYLVA